MTDRLQKIIEAVRPYENAANFSVVDVMAAASAAVPDVDAEEVALAFDTMAKAYRSEAGAIQDELRRRGIKP